MSARGRTQRARLRGAVALVAALAAAGCDEKTSEAFAPILVGAEFLVGSIEGRLTSNGAGIAGLVELTGPATRTAQVGASGDFTFRDLPPGDYQLTAAILLYQCAMASVVLAARQAARADVACEAVPGSLVVTVTSGGSPLEGATVSITGPQNRTGTTGGDGGVRFDGLGPGGYAVGAVKEGYECSSATAQVQSEQTAQAAIACEPPLTTLVVRVVDETGAPIAGAAVNVSGTEAHAGVTDGSGTYTIAGVGPGPYTANAVVLGRVCVGESAEVAAGQTVELTVVCIAIAGHWALWATRTEENCPAGVNAATIEEPSIPFRVEMVDGVVTMIMETEPEVVGTVVGDAYQGAGELPLGNVILRKSVAGTFVSSVLTLQGTITLAYRFAANNQHICTGTYDATYTKLP